MISTLQRYCEELLYDSDAFAISKRNKDYKEKPLYRMAQELCNQAVSGDLKAMELVLRVMEKKW